MKRLTKAEALRILIRHAAQNVAGSGVGIREAVTDKRRQEVADAIERVYLEANGFHSDSAVYHTLGIPLPQRDSFGRCPRPRNE